MKLALIEPDASLKGEYKAFLKDFRSTGEGLVPFVLDLDPADFQGMVEKLRGFSKGISLSPNFVEHSTYWLVNSEKKILGVVNIRHRLNGKLRKRGGHIGFGVCPSERNKGYATEMLKLALEKARDLGITKALLTCDKSNVASARVIRKNGGRLDSEEMLEDHMIRRYWIDT